MLPQLNHAAHGKKHAMELLDGLYRELAILGVVAFVLWSINVSEYSDIEVSMRRRCQRRPRARGRTNSVKHESCTYPQENPSPNTFPLMDGLTAHAYTQNNRRLLFIYVAIDSSRRLRGAWFIFNACFEGAKALPTALPTA